MSSSYILHLRGLPWSTKPNDVVDFLEGVNIIGESAGIHLTSQPDGRASGECYVEVESKDDLAAGLAKDQHHIGKRYIDVTKSSRGIMEGQLNKMTSTGMSEPIVRLRGLPFGVTKEEIAHFFAGLQIKPNGIVLLENVEGRPTGEGFVIFNSAGIALKALDKHKDRLGHRYIEVFKSGQSEIHQAVSRMQRMSGGGGNMGDDDGMDNMGGGMNNMRGGMGRMGGNMGSGFGNMGGRMGNMGGGMGNNMGGGMNNMGGDMDNMGMGNMGGGMGNMGRRNMGGGMRNMDGMGGGMNNMGGGMNNMGGGMSNMGGGMNNMGNMGGNAGNMRGGMANRIGPYDRPGGNMGRNMKGNMQRNRKMTDGHCQMGVRGLPFVATEQDIEEFFSPLKPLNINIKYSDDGKAVGKATVEFATHKEAKMAMTKDKDMMEHRYIELFMDCGHEDGDDMNKSGGNMSQGGRGMSGNMGGGGGNMGRNMGGGNMGRSMGGGNMGMGGGNMGMSGGNMGMGGGNMGTGNMGTEQGNMGYDGSNMGYDGSNTGYDGSNTGYDSSNMGYDGTGSNMGYEGGNTGYGYGNMGYDGSNMAYNNMGYDNSNVGYDSSNTAMGGANMGGDNMALASKMIGKGGGKFTTKMLDAITFKGKAVQGGKQDGGNQYGANQNSGQQGYSAGYSTDTSGNNMNYGNMVNYDQMGQYN